MSGAVAEQADRAPSNCQQEPPYAGRQTVVFSIRFPELTCHHLTDRCAIQAPHRITDCGEWQEDALVVALAKRGRTWGDQNRDHLMLMHTGTQSPQHHGGPSLDGRHWIGTGVRRFAAPAP